MSGLHAPTEYIHYKGFSELVSGPVKQGYSLCGTVIVNVMRRGPHIG